MKIIEDKVINGAFYTWICGVIMITMIILWSPMQLKIIEDGITVSIKHFNSPEDIIRHDIYVSCLI